MYDQTKQSTKQDTRALITALRQENSLGNIDWDQTTWEDLRMPLYSALGAMLYTVDQVTQKYVTAVLCFRSKVSQRAK